MVEWKKLGEVANLVRGRVISKDYIRDFEGEYPVYSSQTANDGVLGYINSYLFDGNYLTWTTDGAYAGTIFRRKGKFSITNVCGLIDITYRNIQQDFLYFWLSKTAKGYVLEGMGNPKLMSNVASTILIPIPSLEEQARIVGILDTFTSAIDNLKEQIAQRRKQYEYYRDQLLDLEGKEGVEMKTLGEIGDVCMCNRIMKYQTSDIGDVPFYKIGTFGAKADAYISRELFEEYKSKYSYPALGEILISASGTIGRAIVFDGMDSYFQDSNIVWIANNEKIVTNRYLYYFYQIAEWKTDGGTIKRLYNYNLKNTNIPVPPLQEQQRIVSILDTFEASIQNMEQQLALREKQYEYYRNKLLTFE
jgi:type I restriction enzyme S subunit